MIEKLNRLVYRLTYDLIVTYQYINNYKNVVNNLNTKKSSIQNM